MNIRLALFLIVITFYTPASLLPIDLSLESAKEYTRNNSESIRLKLLEIKDKKYALKVAEALRLPELKMQASATYMTDPPEGITIPKGSFGSLPDPSSGTLIPLPAKDLIIIDDPENTYFKLTTTLTQPIFTWNKINNAIKIARADVDVSELTYENTITETCHELCKIYFSIQFVNESLVIIIKAKEVMGEILGDREKSYDQGRINLQKVLEARSNVASMESKYIEALESYKSGIEALLFYTGLDSKELTLTTGFRTTLPEIDEEQVKARTLHNSLDLTIMKKKLDQAKTYLNIEKGSDLFRPDFSFIISLDVSGGKIPFAGADWSDTWDHNISFTLGTEVKLFDGFKSGIKIKQAQNTRQMAETGLKQMEKGLVLSIRKGIQDVTVKYYAAREKEAKLEEIKEQYKNAKVSYDNDLITRSEERGARVLLYKTELECVWAQYEYETALGELEFLSGMEF